MTTNLNSSFYTSFNISVGLSILQINKTNFKNIQNATFFKDTNK